MFIEWLKLIRLLLILGFSFLYSDFVIALSGFTTQSYFFACMVLKSKHVLTSSAKLLLIFLRIFYRMDVLV